MPWSYLDPHGVLKITDSKPDRNALQLESLVDPETYLALAVEGDSVPVEITHRWHVAILPKRDIPNTRTESRRIIPPRFGSCGILLTGGLQSSASCLKR